MRVFVAMFAVFPILAAAQDFSRLPNLGTYYILGGDLAGPGIALQGTVAGNGFTASLDGYPLPLYANLPVAGETDFSMAISEPAGRDQGLYLPSISGPIDLNAKSLYPVEYPNFLPYFIETGELTTALIDITGAGTYTAPFTMSAEVAYGAGGKNTPEGYVDFVGRGTLTVDVAPPQCIDGVCGGTHVSYSTYSFAQAPELDPASLSGALTLLGGGLLVVRGRRSKPKPFAP
jgi:hypothetical protein